MLFEDDNAADDTNTTDDALVAGPAPSSALVVAPQAPPAGACLSHILLPPNSRARFFFVETCVTHALHMRYMPPKNGQNPEPAEYQKRPKRPKTAGEYAPHSPPMGNTRE